MRYFEYNRNADKPKYVPMTEGEYLRAKQDPNRWFISFGTCVLECEQEEYAEHYRKLEHYRYTLRDADRKLASVISLDALSTEALYEMSVFSVHTEMSVEEQIIAKENRRLLKTALQDSLQKLTPEECYLIHELKVNRKKQAEVAKELGISQQAVSKRYRAAVKKLKEMLGEWVKSK